MTTFIGSIRKADIRADTISRRKNGTVILRRGFFYTSGFTADKFADHIISELAKIGTFASVVESGEIWKQFNGESAANSSHWFVVLAEI